MHQYKNKNQDNRMLENTHEVTNQHGDKFVKRKIFLQLKMPLLIKWTAQFFACLSENCALHNDTTGLLLSAGQILALLNTLLQLLGI